MLFGFFLLASLVSHSPSDPNFIYSPESTEIKNIAGFYGSFTSECLLQSIGLIFVVLTVSVFYGGISVINEK